MRSRNFLIIATLAALLSCTGNPAKDELIATGVGAGAALVVANYIRNKGGDEAATAARIRNIATAVRALASNEPVTVQQLTSVVQSKYPAEWTPPERIAADQLLAILSAGLKTVVVDGRQLQPDDRVRVTAVLDAIISATNYYQPPQAWLLSKRAYWA